MKTCTVCSVEKTESHFRKFGRGLRQVCKACEGREQGETALAACQKAAPERAEVIGPAVEMAPGFGFRSHIEDGHLVIEQDAAAGDEVKTDNIVLSRTEAKVLIAQYMEWAGVAA